MQTFLPYESFEKSASVLDKQRCWKQVVETHQIINILEGKSTSWQNHPAVKMWIGHTPELMVYFNVFLKVCKEKHAINTKYTPFQLVDFKGRRVLTGNDGFYEENPWWLGNEDFHRAMRARLIEKKPEFYLPLFPNDKGYNEGRYWWPVMETKTFRII